jgi:hypothetical protein
MKRFLTAAAAVWAAIIPLRKERETAECKNPPCTTEPLVAMPEQTHSLEEPPTYDPVEWVEVMSSPITHIRRTPENLEWLRQNGLSWRDAL